MHTNTVFTGQEQQKLQWHLQEAAVDIDKQQFRHLNNKPKSLELNSIHRSLQSYEKVPPLTTIEANAHV
jgi:hypothetical protein